MKVRRGSRAIQAWHFTRDTLRDGSPIPPVGEALRHDGELATCRSGLHASQHPLDALGYAPGLTLHRVELGGDIIHDDDKAVASERTIQWTLPEHVMEPLLRTFARKCALDVMYLWDAPDVVRQYLETGDESLRGATRDATRATAWDAAWAAAGAAWAARAAVRGAAGAAARDAAGAAARAAADASWAARDAARDAARAIARATAWDAARNAARARQNRRLTSMVMGAKRTRDQEDM